MPRIRNSFGRFIRSDNDDGPNESKISQVISNGIILKIILVSLIIMVLSPWIYLVYRNNSINYLLTKITEFYQTQFSCVCPNITIEESENNGPKKI